MELREADVFRLRIGKALKIGVNSRRPEAPPLRTTIPLKKLDAPLKKPEATSTRVARVLRLVNESEEFEVPTPQGVSLPPIAKIVMLVEEPKKPEAPLVKKRKFVRIAEVPALVAQEPDNVANFLATRSRQCPKLVVPRVAKVKAFLANKPIVAKPLNMAHLASTCTAPKNAILVELISFNLLGSNIQHILYEVEQASDS
jgi:hypothetical protein